MNKNLGVIFCAYAMPEMVEQSLIPWLEAGATVACCSFPFIDFPKQDNESTLQILRELKKKYSNFISIHSGSEGVTESYARNQALFSLLPLCSNFIILDSDEIYSIEEIDQLHRYLYEKENEFVPIFRINFKNIFGDGTKYMDNFDPARVFRKKCGDLTLRNFSYDNDVVFNNEKGDEITDRLVIKKHVSKFIAHPLHYSWLSNERSRLKVEYQVAHFGNGWTSGCSWRWDYENNCLLLNEEYYKIFQKDKPEIKEL